MEKEGRSEEGRGRWFIPTSLKESTESAVTSLHHSSSTTFRYFQDVVPEIKSKLDTYEHAFFSNIKEGLSIGRQYPATAAALTLSAAFLFLPAPRRLLLRHTLGRFQSDEARFVKAEKNVKLLNISVDLIKKETQKLLQRTTFAEKEMTSGRAQLITVGNHIHRLAKSVNHVESQAADLMDLLREIPGREALRLRAEVASVASLLKQQRNSLAKREIKLSGLGVAI